MDLEITPEHVTVQNGLTISSGYGHRGDPAALAMVLAPNGNIIISNSDVINSDLTHPSELVEFTPDGQVVAQRATDSAQGGAFGMDGE